jgi:hypothetical protein
LKSRVRATRKFYLAMLILVILMGFLTRGSWTRWIGQSLACTDEVHASDVILVENFDPNYLLFERAVALQDAGLSARVVVPTHASWRDPRVAELASVGIVEVMARVARMQNVEIIPIREIEPVSLNAAYQVRDFLTQRNLKSVAVVTAGFRSRRSSLIYHAVLQPVDIQVYCIPVFARTPENWTNTWHGIQEVTEQFLKLQFYRFYVLPRISRSV